MQQLEKELSELLQILPDTEELLIFGRKDRPDKAYRRKSAMAGIGTEIKQREPAVAETEQRITELEQQLEKGRLIDERIKKLKERRSTGRVASADQSRCRKNSTRKRQNYRKLKMQLDESLTLNERLNSENK